MLLFLRHDSHVAAPWLGRLTLRGTLAPQSTGSMTAHACIEREGVAELGRCMLRTSLQPAKPERDTSQDAVAPSLGAAGPTFVIPVSSSRIVRALQL